MKLAHSILLFCATLSPLPAFGQGNNPVPTGPRTRLDQPGSATAADEPNIAAPPKSERQKNKELPQISIIDKLLAIESSLSSKLNRSSEKEWVKEYNKVYQMFREDCAPASIRGEGGNTACTAMALGIKACDAVLTLKARNIEALKNAADQVEVLARKLGATQGELGMANTVKIYANKGQWYNAFLALGRLQRDVLNHLRSNPDKTDLAVLVIVGGWLQGGRCVTHVIDEHYDEYSSNILREQRLVKLIGENMEKLAPVYLNDPLVAEIIKELPDIYKRVDVGFKDPVKQDDVRWLHHKFDDLVKKITTPEKPAVVAAEAPAPGAAALPPVNGQDNPSASATGTSVQNPPSQPPMPRDAETKVESPPPASKPSPNVVEAPHPATPLPTVQKSAGFNWWPVIGGILLLAAAAVFLIRRKEKQ